MRYIMKNLDRPFLLLQGEKTKVHGARLCRMGLSMRSIGLYNTCTEAGSVASRLKTIECAGIFLNQPLWILLGIDVLARDAITPNQDFIIDRHPYCQNLSIAGGGSFHSWKFLPVLGKYVVQMLQGTLDSESASRWAWDRSNAGGAIPAYLPRRDLKEIPGYEV